ncbi:MAG: hypothetical protein D6767_01890 [Candidatus Hydrogenedentota bacterium]|nr:MAG: hypothetical protein D6767_01890 [Candidatus Hydrogenedentota bacterium]
MFSAILAKIKRIKKGCQVLCIMIHCSMRNQWMTGIILLFPLLLFAASRQSYYQKWQSLFQAKNYPEMVRIYQQAIREYPQEAWFYVFLSLGYQGTNQWDLSASMAQKALQLAPQDKNIINNVYSLLVQYAGYLGFQKQEWNKAVTWYKIASQAKPDDFLAYHMLGNAYRVLQKYDLSFEAFGKAYLLNKNHVRQKGFRENLLAAVREGLKAPDLKTRQNFSELAFLVFPENKEIILDAMIPLLQSGNQQKIQSRMKRVPNLKPLLATAVRVLKNHCEQDEFLFYKGDYLDYSFIGKVFYECIRNLPYKQQMNHPVINKVVYYHTLAAKEYTKGMTPIKVQSPLKGRICCYQGAGGKSFHYGLQAQFAYDLGLCQKNSFGTPIYAALSGVVDSIENNQPDRPPGSPVDLKARANFVVLRHNIGGKTYYSVYFHVRRGSVRMRVGQSVRQGDKIAEIGNSGVTAGPHLHFFLQDANRYSIPFEIMNLSTADGTPASIWQEGKEYIAR